MSPSYDVVVIGLGGMGAAAHHLSARGVRVLGPERFGPVHSRGSSRGGSRITRQSCGACRRPGDRRALRRGDGRAHSVIARHPVHPASVTVACGFPAHGVKFVPVVGEILADLALTGSTAHPIGLSDPARLAAAPA